MSSGLGDIERRVVREDSDTVERTIILREVHPTLGLEVRRGLTLQTNTNHMSSREPEVGGLKDQEEEKEEEESENYSVMLKGMNS